MACGLPLRTACLAVARVESMPISATGRVCVRQLAITGNVIANSLGVVEARLRRYDDAFKHLAAASNEYDAHLKLASILEDQKRDRDAIKHYEAALRIQPGTSAVLERLVALYERNGERDKADSARRALGQPKNPQKTTTGGGGG